MLTQLNPDCTTACHDSWHMTGKLKWEEVQASVERKGAVMYVYVRSVGTWCTYAENELDAPTVRT